MSSKFWLILCLFSHLCMAEQAVLEVVPLQHRPAVDLLPLLTPLLDSDDRLVDNGSQLLIKTKPSKLNQIKKLIAQLDQPVTDLMVTVLHNSPKSAAQLNTEAANPPPETGIKMTGMNVDTRDFKALQNQQSIRVTAGQSAFISTGKTRLIQNVSLYPVNYANPNQGLNNSNGLASVNTQMLKSETGFIVTPSLNDQQLSITINPWSEQFQQNNDLKTQHSQTQIHAKLGEWLELASQASTVTQPSSGLNTYQIELGKNAMRILLKVDRVE